MRTARFDRLRSYSFICVGLLSSAGGCPHFVPAAGGVRPRRLRTHEGCKGRLACLRIDRWVKVFSDQARVSCRPFRSGAAGGQRMTRTPELEIGSEPAPDVVQYLEDRIYEFKSAATGITDGAWLVILARDAESRSVAGLSGTTWGGCLEIRRLWVEEARRRQGLGTRLYLAEQEAHRRGC